MIALLVFAAASIAKEGTSGTDARTAQGPPAASQPIVAAARTNTTGQHRSPSAKNNAKPTMTAQADPLAATAQADPIAAVAHDAPPTRTLSANTSGSSGALPLTGEPLIMPLMLLATALVLLGMLLQIAGTPLSTRR